MNEFAGPNGLMEFRKWWTKVQKGQDTPDDNKSAFRRRFVCLLLLRSKYRLTARAEKVKEEPLSGRVLAQSSCRRPSVDVFTGS